MDKHFQRLALILFMVIIFFVSAYYAGEMMAEQNCTMSANETWNPTVIIPEQKTNCTGSISSEYYISFYNKTDEEIEQIQEYVDNLTLVPEKD